MANLLPLVPLLLDLFSGKGSLPPAPDLPDTINDVDRQQDLAIDDLKAAVLDLRQAMLAMATQMRKLTDRVEGLEGESE